MTTKQVYELDYPPSNKIKPDLIQDWKLCLKLYLIRATYRLTRRDMVPAILISRAYNQILYSAN